MQGIAKQTSPEEEPAESHCKGVLMGVITSNNLRIPTWSYHEEMWDQGCYTFRSHKRTWKLYKIFQGESDWNLN